MVCNLHYVFQNCLEFGIEGQAFQGKKTLPGWMKNSAYYCPDRGANPQPPAHQTS